jgi:hypothetical protein
MHNMIISKNWLLCKELDKQSVHYKEEEMISIEFTMKLFNQIQILSFHNCLPFTAI